MADDGFELHDLRVEVVAPDAHTRGGDLDTGEGPAARDRGEVDRCPDPERLGAGAESVDRAGRHPPERE